MIKFYEVGKRDVDLNGNVLFENVVYWGYNRKKALKSLKKLKCKHRKNKQNEIYAYEYEFDNKPKSKGIGAIMQAVYACSTRKPLI